MREKLKELVKQAITTWEHGTEISEYISLFLISNGVTIQQWTPTEEKLPELNTKVLCLGVRGGIFIAELCTWGDDYGFYWSKKDGKICGKVVSWMPLPEREEAL